MEQQLQHFREASSLVDELLQGPQQRYEALLAWELAFDGKDWHVAESEGRRRIGSHYTPESLASELAARTLAPLVRAASDPQELLALRICDPAVGAGSFLLAARNVLVPELVKRGASEAEAFAQVTSQCLFGCDRDPIALWLARRNLGADAQPHLVHGNALFTLDGPAELSLDGLAQLSLDGPTPHPPLTVDWSACFPDVFGRSNPGFDAIVGNPPWVAYVGRATQPLPASERAFYQKHYRSFRGYRTLHGLFVERSAKLLREGGRLGLVLPTSVADLDGYAPTRQVHAQFCRVDAELPDYEDRFPDVFQPCLGLLATRDTANPRPVEEDRPWPLERRDIDEPGRALLQRLNARPKVDPSLFGERGYQTSTTDRARLREHCGSLESDEVLLATGTEVAEFKRWPPRLKVKPSELSGRLRAPEQWTEVALWIRQTARYPICALADGTAFRNSIIAGFESDAHDRFLLLAYLNSYPVRFLHYHKHRDARQGMPQLKVAHLRDLPAPPVLSSELGQALSKLGRQLGEANRGIAPEQREALDALVARHLELTVAEVARVRNWAELHPPPAPRSKRPEQAA